MGATTTETGRDWTFGRSGSSIQGRELGVLVVDHHGWLGSRMCSLLETEPAFRLAGVARSAEEAMSIAERESVDVVVVSHRPRSGSPFWLCRELRQLAAPPAVVICLAYPDGVLAACAVVAGADALVSRYDCDAELSGVLDRVGRGMRFLPSVSPRVGAMLRDRLDPAEQAIFSLLLAGMASCEVAQALRMSELELESRRSALLAKLEGVPPASRIRY